MKKNDLYIADEMVAGILTRLPVKSILRFMCVCNSWKSLISSSHFISSQLRISLIADNNNDAQIFAFKWLPNCTENSKLIGGYSHQNDHFQSMLARISPHSKCNLLMVGCTAGLICYLLVEGHAGRFIVFNPDIGCFRSVPSPDVKYGQCRSFVFDDTTLDYYIFIAERASYVYIYSLNSDSWRDFPCQSTWLWRNACNAIFVNGSFHWVAYDNESQPPYPYVMVFNLKSEAFGQPIPISFTKFVLREFTITQYGKSSIGLVQRIRDSLTNVWKLEADSTWEIIAKNVWVGSKRSRTRAEAQQVLGFKSKEELFIRLYNSVFQKETSLFNITGSVVSQNINNKKFRHLLDTTTFLVDRVDTHIPSLSFEFMVH